MLQNRMALTRKPFAEFAAELAAGIRAGRADEPTAENARLGVIEIGADDWRLTMVLDHARSADPRSVLPSRRPRGAGGRGACRAQPRDQG